MRRTRRIARAPAALMVLVSVAALLSTLECGGDGNPAASPVPSTPASVAVTPSLADPELQEFLGGLAGAVGEQEADRIQSLTTFANVSCESAFEPQPSCIPGETISAVPVVLLQSEGFYLPEAEYSAFWNEYLKNVSPGQDDEAGGPEARLYAYGIRRPFGSELPPPVAAAITRIAGPRPSNPTVPGLPGGRQLIILDLEETGNAWRIVQLVIAPIPDGLNATISDLFATSTRYE
jgi:hypothetical protein